MKNLLIGFIATVMFGFAGNAQSTDFDAPPSGMRKIDLLTNPIASRLVLHVNFGRRFWSGDRCGATVTIDFDRKLAGGKYLFTCDKLNTDFDATAKYFGNKLTSIEYGVFLPAQKLIYDTKLGGYLVTLEVYKK